MIPLAVPNLTGNERKYLNECIDTGFVSSVGQFVNTLEEMAADSAESQFAVATSCGTTALHVALMAVGVRPGDLVIVPSMTFIASANAIAHCGAAPWFLDVDADSWTMSASQLKSELATKCYSRNGALYHSATGKRVSAILPVYTLGNTADMDSINDIAHQFDIPVIADAACALGARYKDRSIGSLADVSAVSLNGNKTVTAGGGGLVITDSDEIHDWAKHVSTTARVSPDYDFDMVGYNYRMTNLQAAVACAQLERLEEFVERKQSIRRYYNEAFYDLRGVSEMPVPGWCRSSCWFSGIVLDSYDFDLTYEFCKRLNGEGVGARTFWKPVSEQLPYKSSVRADCLDTSITAWKGIVTLPCSTGIEQEEMEHVVKSVNKVANELL